MKNLLYYSVAVCIATSSLFYSCGPDDDGGGQQEDPISGTFVDERDNTEYKYIRIGTQTWMAENLNYRDVDAGVVSCYDNNEENCDTLGALYDFEAAQNACPTGWHLPSDEEWKTLEMALGMSQEQVDSINFRAYGFGSMIKANGESGLDLQLGGSYDPACPCYYNLHTMGAYWTSTDTLNTNAYIRSVTSSLAFDRHEKIARYTVNKNRRNSVRCIKD